MLYRELSLVFGDPVTESAGNVHSGSVFHAVASAAILGVKVQVGGPGGVILLVYVEMATVLVNASCVGSFQAELGVGLHDGVVAQDGTVDHDGEYVAALAFLFPCMDHQVVMAVSYEGNLHVLVVQLDGVAFGAVNAVLDESSAFYFPTVVDVAAGDEKARPCYQGTDSDDGSGFSHGMDGHASKLEIIFVV